MAINAVDRLRQEVHMPARNDVLKDRLSRFREINISVTGRNSGHDFNPGLVRIGTREALSAAGAGFGYTVVQERVKEPVDSDRCARRRGETSGRSDH
jgi:hypothetical protein